jgi:hypothetical protein
MKRYFTDNNFKMKPDLSVAHHGVGLAGRGLSISKYCRVETTRQKKGHGSRDCQILTLIDQF